MGSKSKKDDDVNLFGKYKCLATLLSFVQTGGVEVEELFGDVPSPVVGDTGT
jgi:hypothetical protein